MTNLKHIVVVQSQHTPLQENLKQEIIAFFTPHGVSVEVLEMTSRECPVLYPQTQPDMVLILGGDGTFLRAAHCLAKAKIPLVGINTGHLGFLTRIESAKLVHYLQAIVSGQTAIEQRGMLSVNTDETFALNDVVIKSSNPSRLAKLNVYINGNFLARYDADGLIVATPTGSTAYNLSAGGPVVDPLANVTCVTPICPHSFSAKPIVIPQMATLQVASDNENPHDLIATVDGIDLLYLKPGERLLLSPSPYQVSLVVFPTEEDSFYAILKRKLGWGANPRST